jgi:hypothetical protein
MTRPPRDGSGTRELRPPPPRQTGPTGCGLTAGRTAAVTNGKGETEPGRPRLRIFVCGSCSTTEVVPWCGQAPDCGHPECADALARCAAPHQLDGRRFHGPVNVILIDGHLWDGHDQAADQAS